MSDGELLPIGGVRLMGADVRSGCSGSCRQLSAATVGTVAMSDRPAYGADCSSRPVDATDDRGKPVALVTQTQIVIPAT
jgi:hypothetical protein